MTDIPAQTTDTSVDIASKSDFVSEFRQVAEAIGYLVIALAAIYGVYSLGKSLFYDYAFNEGFESGRASIATACANPDEGLRVARGCPVR